jgi:hypothetical protein
MHDRAADGGKIANKKGREGIGCWFVEFYYGKRRDGDALERSAYHPRYHGMMFGRG